MSVSTTKVMNVILSVLALAGVELIFSTVADTGQAVFWIGAGNSADNTGVFLSLLGSDSTEPRPRLLLTPP